MVGYINYEKQIMVRNDVYSGGLGLIMFMFHFALTLASTVSLVGLFLLFRPEP